MSDKELRPWGWFEVLLDENNYKLKRILVQPGHRLSYQTHKKRSEHWMIVQGKAKITLNDETIIKTAGQTIDIELESKHRIENIGKDDLVFIELQTGSYFGEDDIVRIEDDYKRV